MKKLFAIVALVASMFVAGNVQAQSMIYAGYAPESFIQTVGSSTSTTNYQGFCFGFTQNFGLSKGIGVAAGADLRMNKRSGQSSLWILQGSVSETQVLVDVPILFNYGININRDVTITPFIGPMASLALVGQTKGTDPIFGENTSNWYGDNSTWSRFNLYGVLGVNLQFSQFNLFGGYRLGLIVLNSNNNITLKTNGLFVGLGFAL